MEKADIKNSVIIPDYLSERLGKGDVQPIFAVDLLPKTAWILVRLYESEIYSVDFMYKIGINFAKKFTNTIDILKKPVL